MPQYLPDYLYKFKNFNSTSLDILQKKEIFFSPASQLNDPFELKINIFLGENSSDTNTKNNFLLASKQKNIKSVNKELNKGLRENYYIFSVSEVANGAGLYGCESLTSEDILLFSHYSQSHAGFCIEFKTKSLPIEIRENACKVNYSDRYPRLDLSLSENEINTKNSQLLATKNRTWSYEREWRVLIDQNDIKKLEQEKALTHANNGIIVKIPDNAIHSVILGCKISKKNKEIIKEILEETTVSIYETFAHDSRYELNLKKIK